MQNPQGPEREVFSLSDLVRWGPILSGFFAAMGFQILSLSLGIGVGVIPALGAGAAVWAVATFVIASFGGGWIAARSLAVGGRIPAMLNALVVWGLLSVFTVILLLLVMPVLTSAAAWGAFIATIVGVAAAIWGGLIGMHTETEFVGR